MPLVGLIRLYQLTLSPMKYALLGPNAGCRFYPTCSAYALQALRLHGLWRGSLLAAWRIMRCHPFHPGGCDPVPGMGHEVSSESDRRVKDRR